MQCYDCAIEGRTTAALVTCVTCGAGLCMDHLVLGHADELTPSVGNPTATRLPGRRFLCQTDAKAGAEEEPDLSAASIINAPDI